MKYEFVSRKSSEFRAAVEKHTTRGEPTRLNYRRGMGGGLNTIPFQFKRFVKTTPTFAVQLPEAFEVETIEGVMTGKRDDYLAVGAAGELYPIDRAVFEATYRESLPEQSEKELPPLGVDSAAERWLFDLKATIEIADHGVEQDFDSKTVTVPVTDWNRIVAVARGHISDAARNAIERFRSLPEQSEVNDGSGR